MSKYTLNIRYGICFLEILNVLTIGSTLFTYVWALIVCVTTVIDSISKNKKEAGCNRTKNLLSIAVTSFFCILVLIILIRELF